MPKEDELRDILKLNRDQALDLSTRIGRQKTLKILQKAQTELIERLHKAEELRGKDSKAFGPQQLRVTLRQVEALLKPLTRDMKDLILSQGKEAADKSTGGLLDYLGKAQKQFKGIVRPLPLKEASVLTHARSGVEASILRRLASSGEDEEGAAEEPHKAKMGILQRYGVDTISNFEETLQQKMLTRASWADTRAALVEQSPFLQGAPAHWAERIVRTETMGAYNRAGWEATRAADKEFGDMVKILSATFDDRTGWDSYQVHGQIRRPSEAFQWSDGNYQHPPNRPNDREVVVPHRISWPIPPYLRWKSDGEVLARYHQQRKSGSPGGRPMMTTVPLERFGK